METASMVACGLVLFTAIYGLMGMLMANRKTASGGSPLAGSR